MNAPVEVVDYDPTWPETFATVRNRISDVLGALARHIEHVGSTAVPGLAAKPIIDIDVVIDTREDLPTVISRLDRAGYRHQGDRGIPGREAFATPPNAPAHHLYVCAADSEELARHLAFRDALRTSPHTAHAYAQLKRSLAEGFRNDRIAYERGKTTFVEQTLATATNGTGADDGHPEISS